VCGINGIFAFHYAANPIDGAELARTRDHMAARGPDGMGEWIAPDRRIGFGHRRLSIIDLSPAGAQPMVSADGKLVVTYNGEVLNHRELRAQLEARGRTFRSQSDTEVLLHLYAEKGADMVHDLRGMFAFAIWDAERRSLFLARDPYGIKPLYYADDGWTFRFASQVKALLAGGAISHEPEPAGQVGFYLWGSVPEPFTVFRDIRALPAGTTLVVDHMGAHEPRRYHSISAVYGDIRTQPAASDDEVQAEIRDAVLDSVRQHLVADVPVGAFLSAGIDSGALIGLMRDPVSRTFKQSPWPSRSFGARPRTRRRSPIRWRASTARGTRRAWSPKANSRPICRTSSRPWTSPA
jgi:asparagine synthase (glutamine-hydrolysing)